ncbi:MAG: DUF3866 family protein [Desulforudis sp.]|nr:DUF3866 family protein [Clostridia bacterium]MDQ7790804.1 DUF3866 family protein [Clostridia bacterium]RJX22661.1 MAG: DUF3866 family protein [Desulforudis sp.]
MIRTRRGRVLSITDERPGITELLVECEGAEFRAVNYDRLTGRPEPGDNVILNTTAVHKALGTGGYHFVIANYSSPDRDTAEPGHIMKLRYTPLQVKVLAAEEEESPISERIRETNSLEGMPVVIGGLHSHLGPFAAALSEIRPGLRLVYLMTDGAALPLAFSRTVDELRARDLLAATVTCGHAFGGDFEAVNAYSGLLTARALGADVVIVAMGPGIVGTGTRFGHTGVEQGQMINAVASLDGRPVVIPRITFADKRPRHQGISHHTLTALRYVTLAPADIAIPVLPEEQQQQVLDQVDQFELRTRHRVVVKDGSAALAGMARHGLRVTSMGRGVDQIPEFFLAAGAAASLTVGMLSGSHTTTGPS